jgi:peptidoglycan/xylan/chitin deacetylase (PgdA/CDA1 family)
MIRNILRLLSVIIATGAVAHAAQDKRIALSFDDAPRGDGPRYTGEERTEALLATLSDAHVDQVVFFVTPQGLLAPGSRARIERYAAAGHLIANHTNTHQWASRVDTDAYIEDIAAAERLLEGIENRRAWYRYPYLDEGRPVEKRDAIRAALDEMGLRHGYVTVDNYDWYLEAKWQEAQRDGREVDLAALGEVYVDLLMGAVDFYDGLALEFLGRSPAHVLLLHENDVAALFVDDLVAALRADGWTIVSPDEAYADPIATEIPETIIGNQGQVTALAIDRGLDRRRLTHPAIEETQIDALLAARNVFGPAPQTEERE